MCFKKIILLERKFVQANFKQISNVQKHAFLKHMLEN